MNSLAPNLIFNNEPSIPETLHRLSPLLRDDFGLISEIHRERQHYDEPKFWHYTASIHAEFIKNHGLEFKTKASGCSFFSQKLALLKCLSEAAERYCNNYFDNSFVAKTAKLKDIENEIVPLGSFTRYSNEQLSRKNMSRFVFKPDSELKWTTCQSLNLKKSYLIPCNFIYLAYPDTKKEPLLYPPISTGVAAGGSIPAAILRGLYECIERDSFMIAYLRKIQSPKIRLDTIQNAKVMFLLELAQRYHMDITCLDLTTDLAISVICAVVIDKSGIGKAISIGLKSNLDPVKAIVDAITEAFHTKGWIRSMHERDAETLEKNLENAKDENIILRGLFWHDADTIKSLDFWLENDNVSEIAAKQTSLTIKQELAYVANQLASQNVDVYWKDISIRQFEELGLHVVKTIVPQLQPLTFDDDTPPLGGNRLYAVPKSLGYEFSDDINTFPHPFV